MRTAHDIYSTPEFVESEPRNGVEWHYAGRRWATRRKTVPSPKTPYWGRGVVRRPPAAWPSTGRSAGLYEAHTIRVSSLLGDARVIPDSYENTLPPVRTCLRKLVTATVFPLLHKAVDDPLPGKRFLSPLFRSECPFPYESEFSPSDGAVATEGKKALYDCHRITLRACTPFDA